MTEDELKEIEGRFDELLEGLVEGGYGWEGAQSRGDKMEADFRALIAEVRRLREALGTADSILQGESAADILVITDGNLATAPTLGAVIRSALNPS